MPFFRKFELEFYFQMFCQFARLLSDETIHVRKHENKSFMKAKHTNIQESYVFAGPIYILSENGSLTDYLLPWIENQSSVPNNRCAFERNI